ncbi:putative secreted protein (Por secretion system target) [Aquimarina sp. MAR_2010_214]|uniref:T9SS type A sorting domain-containing protein n=1 Tax=Aquimarina sp. MAR_2010_214 TaxID=1250026 RepID=UPI000C702E4F|nr:T9SS type A sorting domain-containing protein [Aquimarina sp. MAR_2010_214]PKV50781.1 putative secreted protein (Por secretion system target) [Aquimarina sp. MAR_2010_214]
MKKLLYLLFTTFFLLQGISGVAQEYELIISGYVGDAGRNCGSGAGLLYIEATFENGTKEKIFDPPGKFEFSKIEDHMNPYYFNESRKIVNLKFETRWKYRNGWGKCKSRDRDGDINVTGCYSRNYNFNEFSPKPSAVAGNAIINIRPIITLDTPTVSDIIGYENEFTVTATAGFDKGIYKWQYQVTDGTPNAGSWQNVDPSLIPSPNNAPHELKLTPEDFLPTSVIGKTIYFRILPCLNKPSENVVSYRIHRSAPRIIAPGVTTPVSCYDSTDGTLELTFDRSLEKPTPPGNTGDNLSISIADLSKPDVKPDGTIVYDVVKTYNNIDIDKFNTAGNKILLDGLPPSNVEGFRVDLVGGYIVGGVGTVYYTGDASHTTVFQIGRPDLVAFVGEPKDNKVDVWCHDGSDGEINLQVSGGVKGYQYLIRKQSEAWGINWISFSNEFTHTITGLKADTYEIKIRDANECIAKMKIDLGGGKFGLGAEIVKEVVIDEPDKAVDFSFYDINEPRANGFEDGRIGAIITGGTPLPRGTYKYQWEDEAGNIITTTTEMVLPSDQGYQVILHSVGKGKYTLSVWDANYDNATNKESCTYTEGDYNLGEPDKLEVTIEIYNSISCNIENEYSDEIDFNAPLGIPDQFQDGALVVHAKGGIPFDNTIASAGECRANFMPYCYRWKKMVSGAWIDIAVNDSIIENQSVGTYALNIEDKNGIVLGTYVPISTPTGREYVLDTAIDSTKYLPQPDKLGISFTNTVVTCANGDDAEATTFVVGGTPPYTYEWSTGETTPTIKNLIAGTYLIFVTDAKGCQIEGSVKIEQPGGLEITPVSVTSPTCFEGNDGQIEVEIKGGNPPYNYTWSTGSTSTLIDGLSAGTYRIEVTDNKGCKAFYEEKLIDPDPIIVNLEERRALCSDQSLLLDIAINDPGATYSWSSENGFTSSESNVEITQKGRYVATITSSLGCVGVGDIEVEVFDTPIDSDFLITTQAYTGEEVILVNVSEPMGETVEWTMPEGVEVVSQTEEKLILKFENEGPYDINLRSYQGDCYEDYNKTILVQPAIESPEVFASQGEFIEEFIVYPNPNNGSFTTKITLAEESNITIKIVNLMSGATMHERKEKNNLDFALNYNLTLPTGVYLMLLETPKGSETRKLVFE